MKKLLLAAVFMLAALAAEAQTVTHQSIQGKWKLIYIEASGVSIDAVKKTYTIAEEVKAMMDATELGYMESSLDAMVSAGLEGTVEFTTDVMTERHQEDGEMVTETTKYTFNAGTPASVDVTTPDGDKTTLEVTFKDGNLVLFEPVDQSKVIYTKAK